MMELKILLVDDSNFDIMLLKSVLSDNELLIAGDGIEAMEHIGRNPDIDIMILDLNMPRMNGFEVLEALKKIDHCDISTIILTNFDEIENEITGLDLGAVDYIRKPLNFLSLRKRIEIHASLKRAGKELKENNQHLENIVFERTKELEITRDITIHALVNLLEVRNIESSNHARRTQQIMKMLCEHLAEKSLYRSTLTDRYIRLLYEVAPLHDIGKVGIPDSILLKPGKLTADEFEIMKKHTTYGVEALFYNDADGLPYSFIETAVEIIGQHHERYDGTGYPKGLKGAQITLPGRLMAIIDVYDALISERVYKPSYPHLEALRILTEGRGTFFDPQIVDAFMEIEKNISKLHGVNSRPAQETAG